MNPWKIFNSICLKAVDYLCLHVDLWLPGVIALLAIFLLLSLTRVLLT